LVALALCLGFTLGCSDNADTSTSGRVEGDETGGASTGGTAPILGSGGTGTGGKALGGAGSGDASGGAASDGAGGCSPMQLDCSDATLTCEGEDGWLFPTSGCNCDLTRPTSVEDCADTEVFTCRHGHTSAGGTIRFECTCVPAGERCIQNCATAFSEPGDQYYCSGTDEVASCACPF
jgi:hypothetical protein